MFLVIAGFVLASVVLFAVALSPVFVILRDKAAYARRYIHGKVSVASQISLGVVRDTMVPEGAKMCGDGGFYKLSAGEHPEREGLTLNVRFLLESRPMVSYANPSTAIRIDRDPDDDTLCTIATSLSSSNRMERVSRPFQGSGEFGRFALMSDTRNPKMQNKGDTYYNRAIGDDARAILAAARDMKVMPALQQGYEGERTATLKEYARDYEKWINSDDVGLVKHGHLAVIGIHFAVIPGTTSDLREPKISHIKQMVEDPGQFYLDAAETGFSHASLVYDVRAPGMGPIETV